MKSPEENSTENILFELNPLPMWIYDESQQKILCANQSFRSRYFFPEHLISNLGENYKAEFCQILNYPETHLNPSQNIFSLREEDILENSIKWKGLQVKLLYINQISTIDSSKLIHLETLKKNQNFVVILKLVEKGKYEIVEASLGKAEAEYWSDYQIIGNKINQLFNPKTASFLKEKLQKCSESKEIVKFNFHITFEGIGKKIYQITFEPKSDETDSIQYFACTGTDITEQYLAMESQSFQAKIIDSIGQGVISCDLNGIINFVNEYTCQVLDYKPEELIGQNIIKVFEKSSELDAFFFQLGKRLNNNESVSIETKMRKKGGDLLSYLVTTSAIYNKKGRLIGFVGVGTDLSEIKDKEAELKRKTDLLKYALESANMVSWVYHLDTGTMQRTGPISKLLNIPKRAPFLSSPEFVKTIIHPLDRERVSKAMEDAKKGKPFFEIYRIITPNGETKWVEDSGKMEFDDKGKPIRLGGIMQDVTAEKIKEQIIKESEFTLNSLLNNTSQAFFLLNREQTILKLNLEAKNLFLRQGIKIEEGQQFTSIIHEKEINLFSQYFEKAIKGISTETQTSIKVNDEIRHLALNYNPAYSDSNTITGVVFSATDITENKKYQKELEKLSLVASKTVNGVVIMDANGIIEWVNEGFTRITKYTLDEVIGQSRNSFLFGSETAMSTVSQYFKKLESKKSFSIELFTHDKFGNHLWLGINITPILNKDGEVKKMIAIESDITDKKLREDERIKLIDELTKQNTNLKQFSYIVSHNVRKPVANILGLYALMAMDDIDGKERDELIDYIGNSIVELDHVINDLNNILDIRDNFDQTKTYVRFEIVFQKIINELKEEIKKNDAEIIFDQIEVEGLLTIPGYFQSILYNLINNSIKYRQPDIKPRIEIKILDKGEFIEIVVSDNGLGMNLPQIQSSLFGLYKRFHHHIEGKGLGLYMIKTQTEAMGGKIEVSSKVNEGTTFSVFLKK